MSLCQQIRPFLDGEASPLLQWRMRRHLRACRACSEQIAAEEALLASLRSEIEIDTPEEEAAVDRVTRYWAHSIPGDLAADRLPARDGRRLMRSPRLVTASAAVACAVAALAFAALTGPARALASVADAMKKVQRFHVRIEVPQWGEQFEGWSERGAGARLDELDGSARTTILVDDGKRLIRYDPEENVVHQSRSRLRRLYREVQGFSATRLLRAAAEGRLFEGQDWLGEATAREVARVRRNGKDHRRIQVDLKNGFFERMIVYAERESDRLVQANLYTDSRSPDEEPFARVFFDYPNRVDPRLFRYEPPKGTLVRPGDSDLTLP